jgi:monoamine oxidase
LVHPFEERLFFAGEATHVHECSTAHGVYGSGVRAAEEAIAALTSAADMKPTVSGLSGSS